MYLKTNIQAENGDRYGQKAAYQSAEVLRTNNL
jgi:hypothetical protein